MKISLTDTISKDIIKPPHKAVVTVTHLPMVVIGTKSPYPTVVIVIITM